MKGYLIDTNIPSELTRDQPDDRIVAFLKEAGKGNLSLSVMTIGEISKGIAGVAAGKKQDALRRWLEVDVRSWFAGRILPIDEEIAERWGYLAAQAKQRGVSLSVVDGLLAATALHHGLTLATRNVKDFVRLGIEVFNPWDA